MPRSRLACQFAVLTVLVLHATCQEAQSWDAGEEIQHAINTDATALLHAAEQALQSSLEQTLQSLLPDAAAAAAAMSNTAESHQLADSSVAAGIAAAVPQTEPAAAVAAAKLAPSTASEMIPMRTSHGLALPSKHRLQLQQNNVGSEGSLQDAKDDGMFTAPYTEPQGELQEDYVYLEEPPSPRVFLQIQDYRYEDDDADADADAAAQQVPLPPQLPEDAPSSSSSSSRHDDVAAASAGMMTLQGDVMISSRMPFSSALLQQSLSQPLVEFASDVARSFWQAFARFEEAASPAQLQQSRPIRLQEVEVTVESGSSSGSTYLASGDSAFKSSTTPSSSSSNGEDAMEISVVVESSRPWSLLSCLQAAMHSKQAILQDGLDAAAIAAAVVKALGRRGGSEQQQQQQQAEPSKQQQQMVREMLAELSATGSYEGELQGGSKQLPAATAAAVAAAASAASAVEPWHSMQMELEVTHLVQNTPYSWLHITLLVLAMVFSNIGLFLLVSPWVAKLLGEEASEDDSNSSSSSEKQAQFISAGLAEAGLYQKLLPESADD